MRLVGRREENNYYRIIQDSDFLSKEISISFPVRVENSYLNEMADVDFELNPKKVTYKLNAIENIDF